MLVLYVVFIFIIPLCHCERLEPSFFPNNSVALVYEPPKIFDVFQVDSREFQFADHSISISQDWEKTGVAAVVWDAALVLSRYLESSVNVTGKKIIELGAGTGLVGIVAGLLGANVCITDRKIALQLAKDNIERNHQNFNTSRVEVQELEWGQNVSDFNPPFDYILGADIVYIEETFNQLLDTISELSSHKTVVFLSCKIRYPRDRKFFQLLSKTFTVHQVFYDKKMDIYIYKAMKTI